MPVAVDGWWARVAGAVLDHRAVSVRCFGSSLLPAGACALLLVDLGVGRAVVLGVSAGSGSVLESGLPRPHRVSRLILPTGAWEAGSPGAVCLPGVRPRRHVDRLYSWTLKRLRATAFSPMMACSGVPAAPEEACSPQACCPAARTLGPAVQVLEKSCSRARERPARRCRGRRAAGPWAGCHLSWGRWALAGRPVQPYAPPDRPAHSRHNGGGSRPPPGA